MKFLFLIFLILNVQFAFPQIGFLDGTFGNGGIVTTTFVNHAGSASAVVMQPDGKIIAVGERYAGGNNGNSDYAVIRYNTDGTLDNSFDGDGKLFVDIDSNNDDGAADIALQSDGKIVVAGFTAYSTSIIRLNSDGSMDSSFDFDGKLILSLGSPFDFCDFYNIAMQTDGKIILAGISNDVPNRYWTVLRINSDGKVDSTFNNNGHLALKLSDTGESSILNSVIIQPDGKILLGGNTYFNSFHSYTALRLNSNGTPDSSFGISGISRTAIGIGEAMALSNDGSVFIVGGSFSNNTMFNPVIKLKPNGVLDSSFAVNGIAFIHKDSVSSDPMLGHGIIIQSDGKILVTGSSDPTYEIKFYVFRLNNSGTLDSTFGNFGFVITNILGEDIPLDITLQADNKIIVVGRSVDIYSNSPEYFTVVRYLNDVGTAVPYSQIKNVFQIEISPNPFTTQLQIQYTITQPGELMVYDALGRNVKSCLLPSNQKTFQLSLAELAAGVYLVAINSGGEFFREKVVKQ